MHFYCFNQLLLKIKKYFTTEWQKIDMLMGQDCWVPMMARRPLSDITIY